MKNALIEWDRVDENIGAICTWYKFESGLTGNLEEVPVFVHGAIPYSLYLKRGGSRWN